MEKFNPPSPRSSSGGGESYKNETSPETRITTFSPDANTNTSRPSGVTNAVKTLSVNTILSQDRPPYAGHTGIRPSSQPSTDKDPFVSLNANYIPKTEQKLSPTASSFRPVSNGPLVANGSQNVVSVAGQNHLGVQVQQKLSHEIGITRYLVIGPVRNTPSNFLTHDRVDHFLNGFGLTLQGKRHVLLNSAQVFVRFNNIRDAIAVYDHIRANNLGWHADFISQQVFYQASKPGTPSCVYPEAQIQIDALPIPPLYMGAFEIQKILQGFLRYQGDIFAFQTSSNPNEHRLHAFVEFADVEAAFNVVEKYNGTLLNGIQLVMTLHHPGLTSLLPGPSENNIQSRFAMQDMSNALQSIQNMSVSRPAQANYAHYSTPTAGPLVPATRPPQAALQMVPQQHPMNMYHPLLYQSAPGPLVAPPRYFMDQTPTRPGAATPMSPLTPLSPGNMPLMSPMFTPPATPMTMQSNYTSPRSMQAYGRPDGRRQNAMRVNRAPYHNNNGNHNQVDITRIRDGIDVRTTIMLRNIPNKVDQKMLKSIVDQSSWGKYDFMYLRIDFANDCNVGYAFINFVDPLDIIDFVNARGNKRWNCFKSDKVAEISYATIQGKDCLVQKFRNSSVMLEPDHYRPKLYYTVNGPHPDMVGKEEDFPPPDNQSKMKRSCENAEHVGLFTPNAGQHFRDEQRRRRSQYDRGTRLAALEENDYEAQALHQGLYRSQ